MPERERPELKHKVLAILSLAATKGCDKVPDVRIFELFARLVDAHPDVFPGLRFVRTKHYTYSKQLDSAIQSWVGCGLDLPNPKLQTEQILPDRAERHLRRLEVRFGQEFVQQLEPLADQLTRDLRQCA
jgi:hypothetical protein